jgi:hypothetical protein
MKAPVSAADGARRGAFGAIGPYKNTRLARFASKENCNDDSTLPRSSWRPGRFLNHGDRTLAPWLIFKMRLSRTGLM